MTERSEPGDPALLLYGNNPDGEVRNVTLSHADLLAAAEALMASEDIRQTDETLAWLPMAWFGDALTSQALALSVGFTCNCPEHPETARRDLREIGPTILIAPPRDLGEHIGRHRDARGPGDPVEACAVRAFPHARRTRGTTSRGRRRRAGPVAAEARARRVCWSTRRCAIRSGCAGCAGQTPVVSRLRRACCTAFALSAST